EISPPAAITLPSASAITKLPRWRFSTRPPRVCSTRMGLASMGSVRRKEKGPGASLERSRARKSTYGRSVGSRERRSGACMPPELRGGNSDVPVVGRREEPGIHPAPRLLLLDEAPVGAALRRDDAAFDPDRGPGLELADLLRVGGGPLADVQHVPVLDAGDPGGTVDIVAGGERRLHGEGGGAGDDQPGQRGDQQLFLVAVHRGHPFGAGVRFVVPLLPPRP